MNMWQKLMRHKIWLVMGIVVAIAIPAGITYFGGAEKKASATSQQVVTAERGDISSVISATGTVEPVNSVDISAKITAQIKQVMVKENDPVKAGQVLVVLEDSGLQAQVTQAKERLNNSELKYERTKRLNSIGASSKEQLDDASMDYNIAQASYDQIMSSLNETVITAPIDGAVIGKPLAVGDMVAQGVSNPTVIMTVADMSQIQIDAQVDQTDIGKVAVGQTATFTVDAYPGEEFKGVVQTISRKPVVSGNVTYYSVTINVVDAQDKLNPGMAARVTITTSQKSDVVTLPLAAIRSDKTGKYVVTAGANGKTQNVSVTTGSMSDDRVEIVSGLHEGDRVVVEQAKTTSTSQTGATRQGGPGGNSLNMMRRM